MTVAELIVALQAVPNPAVTVVQVQSAGAGLPADLLTVDTSATVEGGIELADGGIVELRDIA